jgi:hypothetical protein
LKPPEIERRETARLGKVCGSGADILDTVPINKGLPNSPLYRLAFQATGEYVTFTGVAYAIRVLPTIVVQL